MAYVSGGRSLGRSVLGDAALAQTLVDQVKALPYSYAGLFPGVDLAATEGTGQTIGDLVASGKISKADYEAAFGAVPTIDDPNIKAQYDAMVAQTKAGIASGMYTPDSLDSLTPDFYINHYTPFGANAAAHAGGYVNDDAGNVQFVDETGTPVAGAVLPTQAPTPAPAGPPKYLEGGQTFDTFEEAQAALDNLNKQIAAGGSAILPQQAGGTYTPEVVDQMASTAAYQASVSNTPASSTPTEVALAPLIDIVPAGGATLPASSSSGGIPWGLILAGGAALGAAALFSRPSRRRR